MTLPPTTVTDGSRDRTAALAPAHRAGDERAIELHWQIWLPFVVLALLLLPATTADPDLWGHVRFGLDMLASRTLPSSDIYSFAQDRPWVNHEWASEALMAAAYLSGGAAGLVVLKTIVMAVVAAILVWRLRESSALVAAVVAVLTMVGTLPLSVTVRPQIWSALGLLLLVTLLDERRPTPRRILLSSLLFLAWANLHGGWLTGAAVLALHGAVRSVRAPTDGPFWLAMALCSFGATLLNPYGYGLWQFLAATVRATRPDITEWRPFSLHEPAIMWLSLLGPLVMLVALTVRRNTRPDAETIAVVLLLAAAGLRISRVAPLACPAAVALLAPWLNSAWRNKLRVTVPGRAAAGILLAPAAAMLLAVPRPITSVLTCLPVAGDWVPDRATAAALVGQQGRLWTSFTWGEYALWHFGPALRVSIDGRRETIYSDRYVMTHHQAEQGNPEAVRQMIEQSPDFVWLPRVSDGVRPMLQEAGFRIDSETSTSFVAVRIALPPLPSGRPALPGCFP